MNDDTPTINQPDGDDRREGEEETEAREARTEPIAQPTEQERPRKMLRSSTDRVLAGVSGGLGRYFGVDPLIFRIGFVLSLFFGGLGAVAYLLFAVFVPNDGDPDAAQRVGGRLQGAGFWRGLGLIVIAVIAVGLLFALAGGAAFAVAVGWGVPVAIVIVAAGALTALAAFRGGARWLIPPALAIAVGAGVATAADLDWDDGIGERRYHPISATAIPDDGYRLGVGRLVVDLRDLDWSEERVVELDVELGTGQASVFVPERVCVAGTSHIGAGESQLAGERSDGLDVDHSVGAGATAVPRLEVDASVDAGQLRVVNSDTASADHGYGPGPWHEDAEPQLAAEASACATG